MERDSIVQAAKVRAEQIEAQILEDIDQTRKDADQYVIETLTQLEKELERILIQARNGIKALEQQNDLNSEPDITEDINTEFDEIEHI